MGDKTIVIRDHEKIKGRWLSSKKKGDSLFSKSTLRPKAHLDKDAARLEKTLNRTRKDHKKLRALAKSHEYTDKNSSAMLSSLRSIILNMIPVAEKNYQKYGNERAAYAFNALASQLREVENDMRMVADLQLQSGRVIEVFYKHFRSVATTFVDNQIKLRRELIEMIGSKKSAGIKELMNQFVKNQGDYMEEVLHLAENDIRELLLEPPSKPKPKKKK